MYTSQPIYTITAECQDCYKCLRQCPVKAIRVQNGHAMVMQELCIHCGHCVSVCPIRAKRVRNDIEKARGILQSGRKVIASLAPSFISEFEGIEPEKIIAAIKKLGFSGVSETAIGAEKLSAGISRLMESGNEDIYISSACPTVVELIKKYYPKQSSRLTSAVSPLLAHCRLLKEAYGDDAAVVFFGPCISKKNEADIFGDLLEAALTFDDLRGWWKQSGIDPAVCSTGEEDRFIPHKAHEGAMYPVDGGMIAGIRDNCQVSSRCFMAFSGVSNIISILDRLDNVRSDGPVFLELLACEGGCVNGPCTKNSSSTVEKRLDVLNYTDNRDGCRNEDDEFDISAQWSYRPISRATCTEEKIRKTLESIGKYGPADELNCSACGYDSCRAFARAIIEGKAEASMCVGNMRKLAHKKLDAMIKAIPSGVVMVDRNMNVVESNRRFARLLGPDIERVYDVCGSLEGIAFEKTVSFAELFKQVIKHENECIEKDVAINNSVLHVTVFTIEKGSLAGCVAQDITEPAFQKEQIINRSREVMKQNLVTVQKIAQLLGENASASEVILNSIVNLFSAENGVRETKDV